MIFNSHQIKSDILKQKNNPFELVAVFIKDNNFHKFIENMSRFKLNLEHYDEDGNTLLNMAAQCASIEITQYLLSSGADVNTQNVIFYFKFVEFA
jgi:ankyrin repeat protein